MGAPTKASIGSITAAWINQGRAPGGSPAALVTLPEGALRPAYCSTASTASGRRSNVTLCARRGQAVKPIAPHKARPGSRPYNAPNPEHACPLRTEVLLATFQEISAFLAEVERRAFKQAMFAVREEQSALDIVQDAMLKLSEKYADKPASELPMLFQRILQNTIHDHFRRQKVRSTWTTLLSALGKKDEKDEDFDPLETLVAKSDSNATVDPAVQFEKGQVMTLIEQALAALPARQREAFLLRYWEEFDVAETAVAMRCSEGSVKTHCSRAVHTLSEVLKAKGIVL
jgi:RNA polymerase sigma-70 factor (ECF subfamily)